MAHTPGPWKFYLPSEVNEDLSAHPDRAAFLIEFGPGDCGGFWVVDHQGVDCNLRRTNPLHDARLIAEAPRLLEALKAMVGVCEGFPDVAQEPSIAKCMAFAESVIAQAEDVETV